MQISASPQLTRTGVSSVPDLDPQRRQFAAADRLVLPTLAASDILDKLSRRRAKAWWLHHPDGSGIQVLDELLSWHILHFLLGSRSFLDVVRRITAQGRLSSIRGEVYRAQPGPGRAVRTLRVQPPPSAAIGLLINLDAAPVTVEFQDDSDPWNRQQRLFLGDALLFRSEPGRRPLPCSEPNAIFHGWFEEGLDFTGEIRRAGLGRAVPISSQRQQAI